MKEIEQHPLPPFLPPHARLLMLGSFPPPRKRWSMEFFYPNIQNDMWRIFGLHFFGNKDFFVDTSAKCFRMESIVGFLEQRGIALYDTATTVCRLQDNASDKFLEVVEPTDVSLLLRHLPQCRAIVTTGQKATDILCEQFSIAIQPTVGGCVSFETENGCSLRLYRMPSSSRAYPLSLEKKTAIYGKMFDEVWNK
ncbi:MAG: uracil-DNA glycosylase family protein [Bacteroidaceae bacterium]|nr:uracil-DNA glycosylase family protein [Bacteroidaceae bacterium]